MKGGNLPKNLYIKEGDFKFLATLSGKCSIKVISIEEKPQLSKEYIIHNSIQSKSIAKFFRKKLSFQLPKYEKIEPLSPEVSYLIIDTRKETDVSKMLYLIIEYIGDSINEVEILPMKD